MFLSGKCRVIVFREYFDEPFCRVSPYKMRCREIFAAQPKVKEIWFS